MKASMLRAGCWERQCCARPGWGIDASLRMRNHARVQYDVQERSFRRLNAVATLETLSGEMTVDTTTSVFSALSIGDPVTDVLADVTNDTLLGIGGDVGGCDVIDRTELAALRERLAQAAVNTVSLPGGSAANVVSCISSLNPDASCHFAGAIGEDEVADAYTAHLEKVAVRPHFATSTDPSAVSICLVTPDGQRTMRTCLGAAQSFAESNLSLSLLSSMNLVHCEGYTLYKPDLVKSAASSARAAGATFSLDLASFEVVRNCWSTLVEVLQAGNVDIVFCNEDEALEIARHVQQPGESGNELSQDDVEATINAAGAFLKKDCRVAVFTMGCKGALAMASDGEAARCAARKVKVTDTVGAGDAFCGGFLSAYMRGAELQTCVEMGCASGTEAVQVQGARLQQANLQTLQGKLESLVGQNDQER